MSDQGARLEDDDAIARRLCAAILGEDDSFVDALYGVETVEEPKLRDLVEMARVESARLIAVVREKTGARSCEVAKKERQESNLILHLRINVSMLVEAVVDDVYVNDGRLLTRDILKFQPLEGIDVNEPDAPDSE